MSKSIYCIELPVYLYTLYFAYTRVVHVAMDAVASLACHSIPSWQGRVSGKVTRAFNLPLQLGESTWCCQTFDFMISPSSLQLGVYFEKDKSS